MFFTAQMRKDMLLNSVFDPGIWWWLSRQVQQGIQ
jgi:hypothetical protein